jgi:hypothetical protein
MTNRILTSCILGGFAVGALACGSSPPPPAPAPQPVAVAQDHYTGHWEGAAQLASPIPGAPEQMDIVAVLVEGGGAQCGTIEYSHAGCSGTWDCVGTDYGSETLVINENIRFGQERCPTGATIELRRTSDPNVLEFHYNHPQIQAAGQINRRRIQ